VSHRNEVAAILVCTSFGTVELGGINI